jgi:hypothetical protein
MIAKDGRLIHFDLRPIQGHLTLCPQERVRQSVSSETRISRNGSAAMIKK